MNWIKKLFPDPEPPSPLDKVLFNWHDGTPFRLSDAVKHMAIFGATGSGKSSGSGLHFALALVSIPNSGGLILCSKPEDREWWEDLFKACNRLNNLMIFGEQETLRFNFLKGIRDTREMTACILAIEETLERMNFQAGNAFWYKEKKRTIHNAIEMLRLAYGEVNAPDIQRFILGGALSTEQASNPAWKEQFHNKTIGIAEAREKSKIEGFDFDQCKTFWLKEWPEMAAKQRSGVIAEVMSVLHVFNTGIVRELVSTTTNVSPENMATGKWVLIDVNPKDETGRFLLGGWKFITQKWILNRKAKPEDSPIFLWSDEFQGVMNSADAVFLAEARSHMSGMIVLTQSLHSYLSSMSGDKAHHYVHALLTNAGTKIFHQMGDHESAKFASDLLGMHKEVSVRIEPGKRKGTLDLLTGNAEYDASYSEDYKPILQPREFLEGLRTGGKSNGYMVDGWVISSSPFASGQRYLKVAFTQR